MTEARPPLRRRWFRFSLRTMFVVVTVVAIPLGWLTMEWRIVHNRKALKDRLEGQNVAGFWDWDDLSKSGRFRPERSVVGWRPFLREWLFGDQLIYDILIEEKLYDRELSGVAALFPEAGVGDGQLKQQKVIGVYWETTGESRRFRETLPKVFEP